MTGPSHSEHARAEAAPRDRGVASRPLSPTEPDPLVIAEAMAEAADWRRLIVRHREYAVRAVHRPQRRAVWP